MKCRQCISTDRSVWDASMDLRHAVRCAMSSHPNARGYQAKIPALKANLAERKREQEAHIAECEDANARA